MKIENILVAKVAEGWVRVHSPRFTIVKLEDYLQWHDSGIWHSFAFFSSGGPPPIGEIGQIKELSIGNLSIKMVKNP